jgi:hypothetical protein
MFSNKSSTTNLDEQNRLKDQVSSKSYFRTTRKFGVIKEVHESQYAVKILLNEGGLAYNGGFLPIKNPWQQLIHDFGPLRAGLLVEVVFSGDQENTAEVLVIGLEGETIAELQEAPTTDLGLYEIFLPGV